MIIYGYVVFAIKSVADAKTGALMLEDHRGLLYAMLAVQLFQFVFGGLAVYKIH